MSRCESIVRPSRSDAIELAPGVAVCILAGGALGAEGLTTALATLQPAAELPYHVHPCSEVLVALEGTAAVSVAGRRYCLRAYDALHVPAEAPHSVRNASADRVARLHTSFASAAPTREPVAAVFHPLDREESDASCPETLLRYERAESYELAARTEFRDLFAGRYGARGICGGYGRFAPGAALPCHLHEYDESITIVSGTAICQVAGHEYELTDCGTACIPRGRPHRFLNRSPAPMAMIWVYAGDEPQRTLVKAGYCAGTLDWTNLSSDATPA